MPSSRASEARPAAARSYNARITGNASWHNGYGKNVWGWGCGILVSSSTGAVVDHNTVPVEAEATQIPQRIVVSVDELPAGTQILARDLQLPDGSSIDLDPDTLIVNITNAPTAEALEAELAEAAAEAGIEPTVAETAEPTPDQALAESETA